MEYTTIQTFGIRFYFKNFLKENLQHSPTLDLIFKKPNKNNDIVKYYFQLKINYFIYIYYLKCHYKSKSK